MFQGMNAHVCEGMVNGLLCDMVITFNHHGCTVRALFFNDQFKHMLLYKEHINFDALNRKGRFPLHALTVAL